MPRSNFLLRRFSAVAIAALLALASPAIRAADYTDLWWNPAESGWGVNVVQTDNFMFLTFFIYGQDQKPTWYTAGLVLDSTGAYSGGLYATTKGTHYAQPWNPNDASTAQQIGNASFRPSGTNAYEATLTYVVDGVGTAIKAIERESLRPPTIGGQYTGGLSAAQTSCNNSSQNGAFKATYDLQVTQTAAGVATFTFTYPTYACTLSGALVQHGRQYTISGASYQRVQGGSTVFSGSANMSEIVATAQGIEGRWTADAGAGCREDTYFSAVLL
jgi:hypothetical protein